MAVDQPSQILNHINIHCLCEQSDSGGKLDHFGAGHPGDIGRITPLECWYHLRGNTVGHKVSQMLKPASELRA